MGFAHNDHTLCTCKTYAEEGGMDAFGGGAFFYVTVCALFARLLDSSCQDEGVERNALVVPIPYACVFGMCDVRSLPSQTCLLSQTFSDMFISNISPCVFLPSLSLGNGTSQHPRPKYRSNYQGATTGWKTVREGMCHKLLLVVAMWSHSSSKLFAID
jgi:hypothetical protein